MKRVTLHIALLLLLTATGVQAQSDNYKRLAQEITQSCNNDYSRAQEIFRWICANISYDLEGKANSAERCLKERRGTSFGYCQLYARLAQAVGLQPTVVTGKAKGESATKGHCWIFLECDDNQLLIDPMWGSGSINDGKFVRNIDEAWFDVAPEWMIFSHFPQDKKFQLLKKKLSEKEFQELPLLFPYIQNYGFDAAKMLNLAMKSDEGVPTIYQPTNGLDIQIMEVPLHERLQVGEAYSFTLKKKSPHKIMLICGNEYVTEDMWQRSDSIYTLSYRPFKTDKMSLTFESDNNGTYTTFVEYSIAPPTRAHLDTLEKYRPLAAEEVRNLTSTNIEILERMKIDGHKLLKGIRDKEITSLPQFFKDCNFEIIDIPLSGTLEVGKEYLFKIRPRTKGDTWLIRHGHKRFRRWSIDPASGTQEITVRPTEAGELELSVILADDKGFYHSCIKYEVK